MENEKTTEIEQLREDVRELRQLIFTLILGVESLTKHNAFGEVFAGLTEKEVRRLRSIADAKRIAEWDDLFRKTRGVTLESVSNDFDETLLGGVSADLELVREELKTESEQETTEKQKQIKQKIDELQRLPGPLGDLLREARDIRAVALKRSEEILREANETGKENE